MSTHRVSRGFNVERRDGTETRFDAGTSIDAKRDKLTKAMIKSLERDGVIERIGGGDA